MSQFEPDPDADAQTALLPLDRWHRDRGARMVPFAGCSMPIQYGAGIIAEHNHARTAAALFDVSHMGQLLISGDAAAAALEALTPGDFAGLGEGRLRYSMLLAGDGGVLDDIMVTRWQGSFCLVVNGATKADDIAHLRESMPDEVTINHLDDHALLALQGPKAAEVLDRIIPGVGRLGFMEGSLFEAFGGTLWVSRSGYTGEDGFELSIVVDRVEPLADALCAEVEVAPAGLGARDSLRLEAGLPLYGHDLDAETTPIEAGLGFAISRRRRADGGFPGAERIAFELAEGPVRRRFGLAIDGRQPVREGAVLLDENGDEVGHVSSGGFSPTLGRPIAMAYGPAALGKPGTRVQLVSRGKVFTAVVVPLPFVPHRYVRQGSC